MRFLTKILNHFCRGCGTLLSADERQTGLCSSCWFEKEKKQSLDDKDWRGGTASRTRRISADGTARQETVIQNDKETDEYFFHTRKIS